MRKKRAKEIARFVYNYSLTIECNNCQKYDIKTLHDDNSVTLPCHRFRDGPAFFSTKWIYHFINFCFCSWAFKVLMTSSTVRSSLFGFNEDVVPDHSNLVSGRE